MVVSTRTALLSLFLFLSLLLVDLTATETADDETDDDDAEVGAIGRPSLLMRSIIPPTTTTTETDHEFAASRQKINREKDDVSSHDDDIRSTNPTSANGPETMLDTATVLLNDERRTAAAVDADGGVVAETQVDWTGESHAVTNESPLLPLGVASAADAAREAMKQKQKQQSAAASVLDTVPMSHGVYHLTSLRHFQLVVDQQQQQEQQNENKTESRFTLLWVVLLYSTDCAYSPTLLELVQGAAAAVAAEQEIDDDDDDADETNLPTPYYGRILVEDAEDRVALYKIFGIDALPTIALVTADASTSFLVEYTGRTSTSTEIRLGAQHYFDTLTLTSQPLVSTESTDGSKNGPSPKNQHDNPIHPLLNIQPRVFDGMEALQTFLIRYKRRFFPLADYDDDDDDDDDWNHQYHPPTSPVLSWRASTLTEQSYVQWLFSAQDKHDVKNGNDDDARLLSHHVVLLVQCRYYHHPNEQQVSVATQRFYDDFDTMARSLQGRRDRLFFVVQHHPQPAQEEVVVVEEGENTVASGGCSHDGTVDAFEIPVITNRLQSLSEPTERWSEIYTHFQYTTQEADESATQSSDTNKEQGASNNNKDNDKAVPLSLLVEFMIKVCTDPVLWFDRQTTAPIAFSHFRKVHVVLIVDMTHHTVLAAATATAAASNNDNDNHSMAAARANKRAVAKFRRLCQTYRESTAGTVLNRSHMVCLILPSTETRVLTTFGLIDSWSMVDDAFVEASASAGRNDTNEANEPVNETKPPSTLVFPSMLITDQRFGGTLRYYRNLNSADVEIEDAMEQFIESYRNEELSFAVKSSKLGARTNDAGVRIVTADTVERELFDKFEPDDRPHSLILFVAPTCGHCKRFMVIWNRLSLLLKHIEWNSFLQLYQMDVSENDVAATSLNIDIEWLPDVYYVAPGSNDLVRYNVTDELGDGVGAIRDTREIVEWLIHDLDILSHDQIETLLARL